jgi:twitching motility protein PilI
MTPSSSSTNLETHTAGAMSASAGAQAWSQRPSDMSEMSEAQSRLFAEINARQNAVEHKDDLIERQGYRVGDLCILAKFDATSELAVMPPIYRLPGAPDGVKGLANLHGNVVPVFELARWFNVTHDPKATPMLLVLGYGDEAIGVIIDGLPVRKRFSPNDEVPVDLGHPRMARFAIAAYRELSDQADPGAVWMEFDHQRFFETFARRFAVK